MNTMPITMLNGIGCPDCRGTCNQINPRLQSLRGVADYDVLVIGGQHYSANQILDKTLYAKTKTPVYMGGIWSTPAYYVQPGQPIGKVYSYLKPNAARGGRSGLLFYNANNQAYYVLDESAIDTGTLKDQGAQTVKQEVEQEKDEELRKNSPIEYYMKKYAVKGILIIGGIVIVSGILREGARAAINKKTSSVPQT